MSIVYDVFSNQGIPGAPIDYTAPIATVSGPPWTSGALAPCATYKFGVRARDTVTGLSESNMDAVLTIVTDRNGRDVSAAPLAPEHVTCTPIAGGNLRVEWAYPFPPQLSKPVGFHVYRGLDPGPDYSTVVATIAYNGNRWFYRLGIPAIAGVRNWVAVRAFGSSEEQNINAVPVTPIATPPASVQGLSIAGTSKAPVQVFTRRLPPAQRA